MRFLLWVMIIFKKLLLSVCLSEWERRDRYMLIENFCLDSEKLFMIRNTFSTSAA